MNLTTARQVIINRIWQVIINRILHCSQSFINNWNKFEQVTCILWTMIQIEAQNHESWITINSHLQSPWNTLIKEIKVKEKRLLWIVNLNQVPEPYFSALYLLQNKPKMLFIVSFSILSESLSLKAPKQNLKSIYSSSSSLPPTQNRLPWFSP